MLKAEAMTKFLNLRLIFLLLLTLTTNASVVYASGNGSPCYLNGESYPHGSRVGDYICINGEWLPYQ